MVDERGHDPAGAAEGTAVRVDLKSRRSMQSESEADFVDVDRGAKPAGSRSVTL
jgi:hypothetical protein